MYPCIYESTRLYLGLYFIIMIYSPNVTLLPYTPGKLLSQLVVLDT